MSNSPALMEGHNIRLTGGAIPRHGWSLPPNHIKPAHGDDSIAADDSAAGLPCQILARPGRPRPSGDMPPPHDHNLVLMDDSEVLTDDRTARSSDESIPRLGRLVLMDDKTALTKDKTIPSNDSGVLMDDRTPLPGNRMALMDDRMIPRPRRTILQRNRISPTDDKTALSYVRTSLQRQ